MTDRARDLVESADPKLLPIYDGVRMALDGLWPFTRVPPPSLFSMGYMKGLYEALHEAERAVLSCASRLDREREAIREEKRKRGDAGT